MKQCTALTPLEKEVIEILDSRFQLPLTWGRKRLRSAICDSSSSSLSSSLPLPKPEQASSPSPATPFSFSNSESEDKRTLFRKNVSLEKKKEHYLKTIEEQSKQNELFHGELKNLKCYLEKVKELNSKLKMRKQELTLPKAQESEIPAMVLIDETVSEVVAIAEIQFQHETMSSSKRNGGNNMNIVGPNGIPDLNLIPNEEQEESIMGEEYLGVIQICNEKNDIANTKH